MSNVPIVFDVGGTTMRVAAVRGGELDAIEIVDTPKSPREGIPLLISLARQAAGEDGIAELVGDISAVVKEGIVLRSTHLPEWVRADLTVRLQSELGAPVTLFNDAELVALGEYYHGTGFHSDAMAYITVSTGVGGALIVDGRIDRDGVYNYEIGHQLVRGKELEAQISGAAVAARYGVAPKDLCNPEALHELAEILAEGLYNTVLAWSPDTIVLGGSMITGANSIPVRHVEETLRRLVTTIYPGVPKVVKAKLSKLGGLYGGMAYLEHGRA